MTKRPAFLGLALAAVLLTAGCAEAPQVAAHPNAAELDRLVATLEAQAAADSAGRVPDQVASADRIAGTVARLPAEKIDPNLVANALTR